MIALIGQAFRIFGNNFALLAGIALVFGMPRALILNVFSYFVFAPEPGIIEGFFLAAVLDLFIWTLAAGALIAALTGIRSGNPLSFAECMTSGLRNWSRLFRARLLPVMLVYLGLIAFIIPGIYLAIKWLLLDYTVILEGADPSLARKRSSDMMQGVRWRGLVLLLFFTVIYLGTTIPSYLIEEMTGQKFFLFDVCIDTLSETVGALVTITFYLLYWQRREEEMKAQPATSPEPPPLPTTDAVSAQTHE